MTDTPHEPIAEPIESTDSPLSRWMLPGVLSGLLAVTVIAGAWLWFDTRSPDTDSAAAGFARDMTDHHAQAVEMALIAFERTGDDTIRLLAYDIATSQQAQIGMMAGWLNIWDLSSARPGAPMEWMDAADMAGHEMEEGEPMSLADMPGMISRDRIDELRTLDPSDMDIQFLTLMIDHHEGGVTMAVAALSEAEEDVVLDLAKAIVVSQTAEIANMQAMLAGRGAS
ncbi:DUF305 domain-containing protein [soil metagenome]